MAGIFYGIGTGPGDPELMTIKAIRTIRESDVIALPVSDITFFISCKRKLDENKN